MHKYLSGLLFAAAAFSPISVSAQSNAGTGIPSSERPGAAELKIALRRLASNRRNVNALINAGNASLKLDDAEAALNFFRRAENLRPTDGQVKAGLGSALVRLENPFEALRYFDEAVRLGTSSHLIAMDRGLAFDLLGNFDRAHKDYALAARYGRNDQLTIRHAVSLALAGKISESEKLFSPLLRQNNSSAWRARAFTLAANGKYSQSREVARAFLDRNSVRQVEPFLKRMPKLTSAQQAAAIHLGHFPTNNVGRDSENVRFAAAQAPSAPTLPATGSSRLVPAGTPLGQPSSSVAQNLPALPSIPAPSLAQQLIAEAALASANVRALLPAPRITPRPAPTLPAAKPILQPAITSAPAAAKSVPAPKQIPVKTPAVKAAVAGPATALPSPAIAVAKAAAPTPTPASAPAASAVATSAAATPVQPGKLSALPTAAKVENVAAPASAGFESLAASPGNISPTPKPNIAASPKIAAPAPVQNVATAAVIRPNPAPLPVTAKAPATANAPAPLPASPAPAPATKIAASPAATSANAAPKNVTADRFNLDDVIDSIDTEAEKKKITPAPAIAQPKPKPAAPKTVAAPKSAENENISSSGKYWVQISTSPLSTHKSEYRRLSRKYRKIFEAREGWSSAWKNTARLVVGPFDGYTSANEWYKALREEGGGGFVWSSAKGTKVIRLYPK